MKAEDLDFYLPQDRIAQTPSPIRDHCRLMVVDRTRESVTHTHFNHLAEFLPRSTLFFRNRIRVRKARLFGKRANGGEVECLLLEPRSERLWEVLLKPAKRLPIGSCFYITDEIKGIVQGKDSEGICTVEFQLPASMTVELLAETHGRMPLPPYIHRDHEHAEETQDELWYQTVFNQNVKPLAAAAPTAGLHFTEELIQQLTAQQHRFFDLDLTVGLGTFKPIQTEEVESHKIHHESYWIPYSVWEQAKNPGNSTRLMVGTTSLRAMEDAALHEPDAGYPEGVSEIARAADIFIYPPAQFRVTDALLTNFHLPRSTLLCLVGAFLKPGSSEGLQWLKELYKEALSENYRFFSYGDAMLIL